MTQATLKAEGLVAYKRKFNSCLCHKALFTHNLNNPNVCKNSYTHEGARRNVE